MEMCCANCKWLKQPKSYYSAICTFHEHPERKAFWWQYTHDSSTYSITFPTRSGKKCKAWKEKTDHQSNPSDRVVNRSDAAELEASVIAEISKLLAHHPKVLFACRSNSGAAYMLGRDGKQMPVTFNKIIKSPVQMRLSDFWGMLINGKPFAIECKRRNWTKPTDQREHEQAAFLQLVRDAGGIGVFATCAEDVLVEMMYDDDATCLAPAQETTK